MCEIVAILPSPSFCNQEPDPLVRFFGRDGTKGLRVEFRHVGKRPHWEVPDSIADERTPKEPGHKVEIRSWEGAKLGDPVGDGGFEKVALFIRGAGETRTLALNEQGRSGKCKHDQKKHAVIWLE